MTGLERWESRIYKDGVDLIEHQGSEAGLEKAVLALYEQQVRTWPLLAAASRLMDGVELRTVELDGRPVRLQHNPARIVNVSAPTSAEEVANRPCPLCPHNMPDKQMALPFLDEWLVVCNPLPIFKPHFVLVNRNHLAQSADEILPVMLEFSRLTGFVTLYNGPGCGASIPDHLHVQAAAPGWLPLEEQAPEPGGAEIVMEDLLPYRIYLNARDSSLAEKLFERTMRALEQFKLDKEDSEPGMNIVVLAANANRPPLVAVHPRSKHRPDCYYAEGDLRCVISPGSADMAGMMILPRREDFSRLDSAGVRAIIEEVCLKPSNRDRLRETLLG